MSSKLAKVTTDQNTEFFRNLLENVNRLYGLLRTTSRVEEGKANRPPEQKRIDVEKLLSGDQQLDVSSKPPASKSGISQR